LFGEDSVYVLLGTALISAVAKLTAVFTLTPPRTTGLPSAKPSGSACLIPRTPGLDIRFLEGSGVNGFGTRQRGSALLLTAVSLN